MKKLKSLFKAFFFIKNNILLTLKLKYVNIYLKNKEGAKLWKRK
jgi:hypothetical protein